MFANLRNRLTRTQWIAVGFLLIILCGTCLLMLPISSRMPGGTDFLSALFTAASATCVTGLVVVDTYQHWTLFGQMVILLMIQVGGLGFVTFGVTILLMMGKRIGLADRGLLRDSVNTLELGGIVRLAKEQCFCPFDLSRSLAWLKVFIMGSFTRYRLFAMPALI